ncbi:hypothetical protein DSO57_1018974 [Entomophthora muscae]|uniref:Uncharacterized protein n=1 Tax=Entomophthora muscae TaxID=34485 RepID=A0ACC2UDV7_9FUNG|nr:hypothetical protein DSO57_1018974 [Entomophthora muscae]
MAAKRADCVLVVDEDDHLAGIFTAKDLAYRVVAENLDARTIIVENIMTPNPLCVTSDASASDALNTMVQRGFRHLPVCNEEGDVVGLLDITKCLYDALDKMDKAYGSSRKLFDALEGVEKEWTSQAPQLLQLMDSLKNQINCPDVTTVFDGSMPAEISPKATVKEAARAMKANRTTAVLVMENDTIAGIFTSKDVVLRVIAAQLEPSNCSVVRVMTPHPDTALPNTTIIDALKRMHHGHYLNLPIVDEFKQVIGMVDVLKLTYAVLEQINTMQTQEGEGSGPIWNKFWGTTLCDDNESFLSEAHSQQMAPTTGSDVFPHESVSAVDEDISAPTNATTENLNTFVFKFKSPSGKVYRLQSAVDDFYMLRDNIFSKMQEEAVGLDLKACLLFYTDDENDQVFIQNDEDLIEGVNLMRQIGQPRLLLGVEEKSTEPQRPNSKTSTRGTSVVSPFEEVAAPIPTPAAAPSTRSVPEKKNDAPLIPENLVIPAAIGGGFLAALIAVVIVVKATSR